MISTFIIDLITSFQTHTHVLHFVLREAGDARLELPDRPAQMDKADTQKLLTL